MRFCTSCGTPLEKDARFCIMCGAKVIPPAVPVMKEAVEPEEIKEPKESEEIGETKESGEPEVPEAPGESEEPEAPEEPETPDEPEEPEVPEEPEKPDEPEVPEEPELPAESEPVPPQKPVPPPKPVQRPKPAQKQKPAPPQPARPSFFEDYDPAWDDRYAPPQRPAYDNRYAPPQRPAYDNRCAPPRQAYPAYGRPNPGHGRNGPPNGKPPLKNKGLLKFLSFLFALGLLVVSAGLAGTIWFNRYAAATLDSYTERENITERVSARRKRLFNEALIASMNSEITDGLKAQAKFKDTGTDTAYIDKLNAAELEPYRENNDLRLEKAEKQFGFSWTVLKLARNANLFLIAGGILCGFSLILWFALGGRFSRFSRTTAAPLLTMFIIWGICFIGMVYLIDPVDYIDINKPTT